MVAKRKIAVFASGYGSNFEAIARAAQSGEIPAEVVLLVCDKKSARACDIANELGIESFIFTAKEYNSKQEYESAIVEQCKARGVEMICLAGYMRIVGKVLLERYAERIINIHPSLLPSFKGAHAIQDAVDYGVKIFGATTHFVDETLDGGRIIDQGAIVYEGNDIEELTNLIHKIEHNLYVKTINKLINKKF